MPDAGEDGDDAVPSTGNRIAGSAISGGMLRDTSHSAYMPDRRSSATTPTVMTPTSALTNLKMGDAEPIFLSKDIKNEAMKEASDSATYR
jgi:hypothetical protein